MSKEVMQQALDALEICFCVNDSGVSRRRNAMEALREALAEVQPAPQPDHDPYVDEVPPESLINALAEIRDLFPAPEEGGHGDQEFMEAVGDPLAVPRYVKTMLAAPQPAQPEHDLYTDADVERPDVICDSNGSVTLSLCKRCGKGETQLEGACTAQPDGPDHEDGSDQDGFKGPHFP